MLFMPAKFFYMPIRSSGTDVRQRKGVNHANASVLFLDKKKVGANCFFADFHKMLKRKAFKDLQSFHRRDRNLFFLACDDVLAANGVVALADCAKAD